MENTRVKYDRKAAFEEFDRDYKFACERILKPKMWLTREEIAAMVPLDASVRAEIEARRESPDDVLLVHCDIAAQTGLARNALRMAVYWLMEETLLHCPKLRRWCSWSEKDRSMGETIIETETGLSVEWKVDFKDLYSEEVWA